MPDLLPPDFGTETLMPPIVILREQAEHLTRRLGGLVVARVATSKHGGNARLLLHRFMLEVPSLDDYTFSLFSVSHPLTLYPIEVHSDLGDGMHFANLGGPAAFESALRTVFSSNEFKRVVVALRAQAEAMEPTDTTF